MITIWYKIKTFVVGLKIPDTQYGSTGTACSVVEPEPPFMARAGAVKKGPAPALAQDLCSKGKE